MTRIYNYPTGGIIAQLVLAKVTSTGVPATLISVAKVGGGNVATATLTAIVRGIIGQ